MIASSIEFYHETFRRLHVDLAFFRFYWIDILYASQMRIDWLRTVCTWAVSSWAAACKHCVDCTYTLSHLTLKITIFIDKLISLSIVCIPIFSANYIKSSRLHSNNVYSLNAKPSKRFPKCIVYTVPPMFLMTHFVCVCVFFSCSSGLVANKRRMNWKGKQKSMWNMTFSHRSTFFSFFVEWVSVCVSHSLTSLSQ